MVNKAKVFAIAGFAFAGFAAAFLIASFASPYWVESKKTVAPSGFENMGLWVICFHNYYPMNRPITNKRYEGCWQAVSYEMKDLKDHFYPSIIVAVQVMTTLAMIISLTVVAFDIVFFLHCCPFGMEKLLMLAGSVLSFTSGLLMAISCIIFGVKVDQDREWIPQPDACFLSWAYGFGILAFLLNIFAGSCMATDFYRMRVEDRYDKGARSGPAAVKYSPPPPQQYARSSLRSAPPPQYNMRSSERSAPPPQYNMRSSERSAPPPQDNIRSSERSIPLPQYNMRSSEKTAPPPRYTRSSESSIPYEQYEKSSGRTTPTEESDESFEKSAPSDYPEKSSGRNGPQRQSKRSSSRSAPAQQHKRSSERSTTPPQNRRSSGRSNPPKQHKRTSERSTTTPPQNRRASSRSTSPHQHRRTSEKSTTPPQTRASGKRY